MDTVRDIRQQPFYWIERDFLPTYADQIGPHGIAVYNALAFRASREGKAWPGLADLSALTGIRSKTTLRKVLRTLEVAGLITIRQRFTGLVNESNEYFILPMGQKVDVPDRGGVGQEMTQGRSGDDPGRSGDDLGVGQEMTQGRSGDDPEQQSYNNKHATTWQNNNQATSMPAAAAADLPEAALSILIESGIDMNRLDGTAETAAAWLLYCKTQPGLRNPAGYTMTQLRKKIPPPAECVEIVGLPFTWTELLQYMPIERTARKAPSIQGLQLWADLETVSNGAVELVCNLIGGKS